MVLTCWPTAGCDHVITETSLLPLPHPKRLCLACAPGAVEGAWHIAHPSAGSVTAGRWGVQSWGPKLGSREAVKTLEHTLLHLAAKEVGEGKRNSGGGGCNNTPRTSAPLFLPHTRLPYNHKDAWGRIGGGHFCLTSSLKSPISPRSPSRCCTLISSYVMLRASQMSLGILRRHL